MRSQRLAALLAVLLLASLVGNLALVLHRGATAAPTAAAASAPARSSTPSVDELQAQLSQCKGATLSMLAAALTGSPQTRTPTKSGLALDAGPTKMTASDPGPIVTTALEHEELANVALQHLRQEWERSRGPLVDFLKAATTDPKAREAMLNQDLNELAVALQLDASQRVAFAASDTPLRNARLDAMAAQLALPDPDFNRIFEEARGFFADDDRVVTSMYGPASADLYRATQLESRTTVLAILATLANQPWDKNLDW